MRHLILVVTIACFAIDSAQASCFSCFKGSRKMVKDDEPRQQVPPPPELARPPPPPELAQPRPESPSKTAEEYLDYIFDPNASGDIEFYSAREKMHYLRGSINKSIRFGTSDQRKAIDKWYALTQITRCSKENDQKFDDLILINNYYKNFVAVVKREKEIYENLCVTMDIQIPFVQGGE